MKKKNIVLRNTTHLLGGSYMKLIRFISLFGLADILRGGR